MNMMNRIACFATLCLALSTVTTDSWGIPAGYVLQTIPLDAPPVGLAFDADGVLFALEEAGVGNNVATLRSILPDGTFGDSWSVVGDDPNNFFTGSMTYDHVTDSLLISDNTADGRLYSVDKVGVLTTLATSIPSISGVAVRSTGEIFVSTSFDAGLGGVYQIDRATGSVNSVISGLDYGSGLAFDDVGNLFVMEAEASFPFPGRLHQLPITDTDDGIVFGTPTLLADGLQGGAGLIRESENRFFTTGNGGMYEVAGVPLTETIFHNNGNPGQFATAMAFAPDSSPFAPFAGPDGRRLALMADFGWGSPDSFITLFTPAEPTDFNSDGVTDGMDLVIWETNFGLTAGGNPAMGDATQDGAVDGADFLGWQRASAPSPPVQASAIPEPHSLALLVGFLLFAGGRPALRFRSRPI